MGSYHPGMWLSWWFSDGGWNGVGLMQHQLVNNFKRTARQESDKEVANGMNNMRL